VCQVEDVVEAIVVFGKMIIGETVTEQDAARLLKDKLFAVYIALLNLHAQEARKLLVNVQAFVEQERKFSTRGPAVLGFRYVFPTRRIKRRLRRSGSAPKRPKKFDQIPAQGIDIVAVGGADEAFGKITGLTSQFQQGARSNARSSKLSADRGASSPNATTC
jgi:hypothetical protein